MMTNGKKNFMNLNSHRFMRKSAAFYQSLSKQGLNFRCEMYDKSHDDATSRRSFDWNVAKSFYLRQPVFPAIRKSAMFVFDWPLTF